MSNSQKSFHILECVDSTNNYAMQKINESVVHDGDAWFAIEQTSGKGRRGRLWQAHKGENIILSVAINPPSLKLYEQFKLSIAVSLACYYFFKKYAKANTKIKWPNDLYWNDRKAGGILIENVVYGNEWQWAVIGVGININQTDFDVAEKNKPVSLKQITGKTFDPVALARELYVSIKEKLNDVNHKKFDLMIVEYNRVLYKLNEQVKLKKGNIIFETMVKGVSLSGELQTEDTMPRSFGFDEVEWVL